MLLNGKYQHGVSPNFRMPVDSTSSDKTTTIAGQTVQFYYSNAGVLTIDAGQVAGVAVVGSLGYRNIKNFMGDRLAHYRDTSLVLAGGTVATREVEMDYELLERFADGVASQAEVLAAMTEGLSNGEYRVDAVRGVIYLVKADASVTETASFNIETSSSTDKSSTSVSAQSPGAVVVGAVSTSVLAANPDRNYALIVNISDETIYLNSDGDAVLGENYPLLPTAGYEINADNPNPMSITAICASGGKSLTVIELE